MPDPIGCNNRYPQLYAGTKLTRRQQPSRQGSFRSGYPSHVLGRSAHGFVCLGNRVKHRYVINKRLRTDNDYSDSGVDIEALACH